MIICNWYLILFFSVDATKPVPETREGFPLEREGLCVVGLAVSWDNRDAYYVSFTHAQPTGGRHG